MGNPNVQEAENNAKGALDASKDAAGKAANSAKNLFAAAKDKFEAAEKAVVKNRHIGYFVATSLGLATSVFAVAVATLPNLQGFMRGSFARLSGFILENFKGFAIGTAAVTGVAGLTALAAGLVTKPTTVKLKTNEVPTAPTAEGQSI